MKTSKFLEKHGYKFEHFGERVNFKSSQSSWILLVLVMIFLLTGIGAIALQQLEILTLWVIPVVIGIIQILRKPYRKSVNLDGISNKLVITNFLGISKTINFLDISSIKFTTQIRNKNKNAHESRKGVEYRKEILLELKNGKYLTLFVFFTRNQKKERHITQVMDWLHKILKISE